MNMQQFLSNGGLSKMCWILLTFITGLGAVILAGIEIGQGQGINQYVGAILAAILSHAFTIGGSVNAATQLASHTTGPLPAPVIVPPAITTTPQGGTTINVQSHP